MFQSEPEGIIPRKRWITCIVMEGQAVKRVGKDSLPICMYEYSEHRSMYVEIDCLGA